MVNFLFDQEDIREELLKWIVLKKVID
jgi:hypothetical protein